MPKTKVIEDLFDEVEEDAIDEEIRWLADSNGLLNDRKQTVKLSEELEY